MSYTKILRRVVTCRHMPLIIYYAAILILLGSAIYDVIYYAGHHAISLFHMFAYYINAVTFAFAIRRRRAICCGAISPPPTTPHAGRYYAHSRRLMLKDAWLPAMPLIVTIFAIPLAPQRGCSARAAANIRRRLPPYADTRLPR